ncbi:MAG: DUF874 domain-containing protein [Sulfitobacter sp.]|nr:DUF874 domain-containing protein [Sulfitobacter sp.]
MGPIYTLEDVIDMVLRRAWVIILFVLLGCVVSVLWALSVPHAYRSSEVIQIEQAVIADDLAPSTVEGSAARRLQLIEQQLMARDSLVSIIEDFDLYEHMDGEPLSSKVNILRQSVDITGVAAARQGFGDDGAISVLTITVVMGTAQKARDVAHALADRTRALSSERRRAQARETLTFFRQQEETLVAEIAQVENELADYRRANDQSVDGNRELLRSELMSLNDALLELDREIIAAQLARDNIDRSGRAATVEREQAELDAELTSLLTQRDLLRQRRADLSANLETTPEVERELARFDRRLTQLQSQLDSAVTRRNEAEVGFTLESEAQGERLITLEEAQVPDYPFTTARSKRVIMGVFAFGVLGVIAAFLLELRRPIIRTARQMERETGLRPVISIPAAPRPRKRRGLAGFWEDRSAAGQRGRAARLARNPQIRG